MSNENLESVLFELLERYNLEEVVFTLFRYTQMQANLAKTLNQLEASAKWQSCSFELGSMQIWSNSTKTHQRVFVNE
jgi:hypothetical protein